MGELDPTNGPPNDRWRLSGRELFLIFLFWTSLAAVTAANRYLDPRGFGLRVISPVGPVVFPFIEAWLWAAFTPLIFWLSSRYRIEGTNWIVRIPILLVIGVAIAIAVDVMLEITRFELFPTPRRRGATAFAPFRGIGRFRFLHQLVLYFAVLAAGFAREYFIRGQKREREAVELQAQTAALEAQLSEARLDALRMQINPHFLFNTLHAISALVERDPAGVRRMIARLSELLRHTLDSRGADEIPLREELAFLDRYFEIMEIRFQGRLRIAREIEPETLEALVPNLILQPIVENALEHGVGRLTGSGRIDIAARREAETLVMIVRDNGPGLEEEKPETDEGGVGLRNTRARLSQIYGDEAELTLRAAVDGGVVAEIRLPWHTTADLRTTALGEEHREGDDEAGDG